MSCILVAMALGTLSIVLVYRVFSLGGALTDAHAQATYIERDFQEAKRLLEAALSGTTKSDILLMADNADLEVIEKNDGSIVVAGLRMSFEDGVLTAVQAPKD